MHSARDCTLLPILLISLLLKSLPESPKYFPHGFPTPKHRQNPPKFLAACSCRHSSVFSCAPLSSGLSTNSYKLLATAAASASAATVTDLLGGKLHLHFDNITLHHLALGEANAGGIRRVVALLCRKRRAVGKGIGKKEFSGIAPAEHDTVYHPSLHAVPNPPRILHWPSAKLHI